MYSTADLEPTRPLGWPALAIAWGWLVLLAVMLAWGAATWAGPYGWIVSWEIENGHGYSPGLTLGILALVLGSPATWVLHRHDTAVLATLAGDPDRARRGMVKTGWWTIGASGLLAVVGSICLVCGLNASDGSNPVPITIADLRAGTVPQGPVVLNVSPDDEAVFEYTEFNRRSSNVTHTYRGVRDLEGGAEGKTGPLILFTEGESRGGAGMGRLADGIQVSGFIERNALPDFVRRDFAARGIAVADTHFVIRHAGPRTGWLVGMGLCYAFAFVSLLVGLTVLVRGSRRG